MAAVSQILSCRFSSSLISSTLAATRSAWKQVIVLSLNHLERLLICHFHHHWMTPVSKIFWWCDQPWLNTGCCCLHSAKFHISIIWTVRKQQSSSVWSQIETKTTLSLTGPNPHQNCCRCHEALGNLWRPRLHPVHFWPHTEIRGQLFSLQQSLPAQLLHHQSLLFSFLKYVTH